MKSSFVLYGTVVASCFFILVSCAGSDGSGPDLSGTGGGPATGGTRDASMGGAAGTSTTAAGGTSMAGSGGLGDPGAAGNSGATLSATWSFPSLITTGTTAATFPTYVAHLLGRQITEPFPTTSRAPPSRIEARALQPLISRCLSGHTGR